MAMLVAGQTINAVGRKFTRGFLVVTPGVTIRVGTYTCGWEQTAAEPMGVMAALRRITLGSVPANPIAEKP